MAAVASAVAVVQLEAAADGVVGGCGSSGDGVFCRGAGEQREVGSGAQAGAAIPEGIDEMAGQEEISCHAQNEACSAEGKKCCFSVRLGNSAELGDLGTCREFNACTDNEVSCAHGGEEFSSEEVVCAAVARGQGECRRLVVMEGNGMVALEEKISNKPSGIACEEPRGDTADLSDSKNTNSEGSPRAVECVGSAANANLEQENGGKVGEEIARPVDGSSPPSASEGRIDVSICCKAGQICTISESDTGMEKTEGEDKLFCRGDCRVDPCAEEDQPSTSEISQRVNLLESKAMNREGFEACAGGPWDEIKVPLQQTDQEDGCTKDPLEGHLNSFFQVQPCEEAHCCRGKESSALQQSHQDSAGLGYAASGNSTMTELYKDFSNNYMNSRSSSGSFNKIADTGESVNPKPAQLIVFRRRNPRRAASSRSTQNVEKPDQLNGARNGAGKFKKEVGTSSLLLSTMLKFPKKITKRRSCFHRSAQNSIWGSLENLIGSFCQNNVLSASDSCPTWLGNEKSRKRRSCGGKKQPSVRRNQSSSFSNNKFTVPSDIGHAKDALNVKPTLSVMADAHALSEKGHEEHIPNLALHEPSYISNEVRKPSQHNEIKCILKLKLPRNGGQQLERDSDSSVTQETYSDYVRGECAGLSSEPLLKNVNGTVVLDPGSSPDSVVYNPALEAASVTCESNTSANHVPVHESLLMPDSSPEDGLHAAGVCASNSAKNHATGLSLNLEQSQAKTEKGNKSTTNVEVGPSGSMVENNLNEGSVQASGEHYTSRKPKSLSKHGCKKKDLIREKNSKSRSSTKVSSRKGSKYRAFSSDPSVFSPPELPLCKGSPKSESCFEALTSIEQDLGMRMHEHDNLERSFVPNHIKGDTFIGSMKSKALRHKRKDGHGGRKSKELDLNVMAEKNKSLFGDASHNVGSLSFSYGPADELATSGLNELSKLSPPRELACKNSATIATELPNEAACGLAGPPLPPRVAWVCCDDCQKWRCIPAALADVVGETNCRWTCKDNEDKAFADCSITQEKTNAEINAELELSDCDEDCNAEPNSRAFRPPSWTHIRSNLFLHRNRRTQSIDESMVCNCKPSEDGRMGCRDGCLNRILNIECVKRTCPCGDLCSNQKFQRRNYAKLRWFHSGKKGYGLQLKENVSEGHFLIEYVGEVLDINAYESRQRYYASKGQKHFYFMALNGGEVIDACTKGNLGRFINHSCSPNCRTEKWMVNGEVCIGIFATRDIKKGEELTFDYNYVRVAGAAPQKCFCGSAKCRGYIGGDILGADSIIQSIADGQYFEHVTAGKDAEKGQFVEHVAVGRDAEKELGTNDTGCHVTLPDVVENEETPNQIDDSNECSYSIPELEVCQQAGGTLSDISEPDNSLLALCPQEAEDIIRTPVHVSGTVECSLQCLPVQSNQTAEFSQKASSPVNGSTAVIASVGEDSNLMPHSHDGTENKLKCDNNLKLFSPTGNAKNGMESAKTSELHKDKRVPIVSTDLSNEHHLGVEHSLNELLDSDGGISKRKNATNGYLKLLFVTAAEGENAGGASKSVRDLSLILDALLKTKSHTVLLDVVNKNGLQMLHNILKQNRSSFHRIPIIRKLLKVLEFLALKGILTQEHINRGPPCAGMESFRDSMLSLTRHNDSQVHQIARNFRDKWIPRTMPRNEPAEREDAHLHSQGNYFNGFQMPLANHHYDQGRRDSNAVVCADQAAHPLSSSTARDFQGQGIASVGGVVSTSSSCADNNSIGRRKRKSRWDQPSDDRGGCQHPHDLPNNEDQFGLVGSKFQKACSEDAGCGPQVGFHRNDLHRNGGRGHSCDEFPCTRGSSGENVDEDAPPGFGSQDSHPASFSSQLSSNGGVAPGYRQERYQPHLGISYGIPVGLVQQFGTPGAEGSQCRNSWRIAPGMPFHPFPPLPPYPRGEPFSSTSSNQMCQRDEMGPKQNNSAHYERPADRDGRAHRNYRNGERARWSSNYERRSFPRQWNNQRRFERHWRPWPREHWESAARCRE